ncbi:MAG: hypothetical protein JWO45_983 [Spartobacteria bacterium]|nr:hypothetical protein [Spartobacteria bacterium]
MSSKPARPRSIASELVFLFTLSSAFLLTCGLGIFYWIVVRHAFAEDNAVMADKMSAVKAAIETNRGPQGLVEELKRGRSGEQATYWIRVLDSGRRTLAETPGMGPLLPTASFPEPLPIYTGTLTPTNHEMGGQLFSLATVTATSNGQSYTVQLAQDRSADRQLELEFAILFASVLVLGILASAAIGLSLTKRALRPLTEMKSALERIKPSHLSERVAPIGWPAELQPVALAFDDMLGRLESSFKRLSQFSADLAHELRTPLANALGEAQVTLARARTSEEYRSVIESTAAECEKLSGIVENLLFVARADAAREEITKTQFDGRAALEKIVAYYQPIAEERNIAVVCAGEGHVLGDSVLFSRALTNVIDNALRFTPGGGTIKLAIAADSDLSRISVSDTGSGIAGEHIPRVFDRFYRADSSRSTSGTGLGLALVKSIMDLHGGSARIESELHRGTTVVLTFPNPA